MLEARGADHTDTGTATRTPAAARRPAVPARLPVVIVLHQAHSTPGHIGQVLQRLGHTLDIRRPRFGDPLPETLDAHAGAVIFGGPMSANDPDDFIRVETEWIDVALKEKKPFLGVCLGAQMLARHLGARVDYHPEKMVEVGYHPIEITQEGRRFDGWPESFYQWHREGFDLPTGAALLARRADGPFPNQAFSYGGTAVGVQFHPEITNAQIYRWTGFNPARLTQPGAMPRDSHLEGHLVHGPRVRSWLENFLATWLDRRLPFA